ncbi:MAG: S8 family serine peptidase [Pseudomonadota bacterium]
MAKLWTLTAVLAGFALAACSEAEISAPQAGQQADGSPWRVAPANDLVGQTDLILTVPAGSPAEMAALAEEITARYGVEFMAEWPLRSIGLHCIVVRATGQDSDALLKAMQSDDQIEDAQRIQVFETLATSIYDDELVELQDSLRRIRAIDVHGVTTGADIRVGIVDTGVDFSHPDLASRQALLRDFVGPGGTLAPAEAHGTAIAGVIAADAGNGQGIVGVAPGADLLGLRGCWEARPGGPGRCSTFSLARALNFAIENDIDVLNMSLAGPPDPLLAQLVARAVMSGMILVAAEGSPGFDFPGAAEGVIAVAKSGPSSPGRLVAPGVDVLSTAPNAGYDFFSGNSVATAHVTGLVALLLQVHPGMAPDKVARTLRAGSQHQAALPGGDVVDICLSLKSVTGQTQPNAC